MKNLKNVKMFLLDMDGTIYLDDNLFDGSLEFLNKIKEKNKDYIFLTNNSSKSKTAYLEKLKRLGISVNDSSVFTSGMAMGMYINEHYQNKKVYLVGTKSLEKELIEYNINLVNENPDIVLIGFDRELTYEKLEKACEYLDNGALFLATNTDYVCPIKNGRYIPDCGSICKMLTTATNRTPKFIGKPEPDMINIIKAKYHLNDDEVCMIGDRVYTDIACGYNANVVTICVLSGESTMDTINDSTIKPDFIFNSVKDIINEL